MGQVLHGSATTTETVRRALQSSQASIRTLARQYGINPKTVAKWKKRAHTQDVPMGPKQKHSTVLSVEEEALIVAFRRHTLLRWMTAYTPYRKPCHTSHDPPCIVVCSDMALAACPK